MEKGERRRKERLLQGEGLREDGSGGVCQKDWHLVGGEEVERVLRQSCSVTFGVTPS